MIYFPGHSNSEIDLGYLTGTEAPVFHGSIQKMVQQPEDMLL